MMIRTTEALLRRYHVLFGFPIWSWFKLVYLVGISLYVCHVLFSGTNCKLCCIYGEIVCFDEYDIF